MKKKLLTALTVLFAAVFCVSGFLAVRELRKGQKSRDFYRKLAEDVRQETSCTDRTEPPETEPVRQIPEEPAETFLLPEYAGLYQQNPDLVGWLTVPGTRINYPVVQTPEDPDHYLHLDFSGEYAACGCLYAQADCDVNAPSDNIVIYGHNMRDESMFGELDAYEREEFWEEHRTILFDTLTEHREYEIVSVFKTFVYSDSPEAFPYYKFVSAENPEEFDAFLRRCRELQLYETGVDAEYGDRLITLSTCEYSRENGRLAVVAKQKIS